MVLIPSGQLCPHHLLLPPLLLLPLPLLPARLIVRQRNSQPHLRRLSSPLLQLPPAGVCCACGQHPAHQQHCPLQLRQLLQANRQPLARHQARLLRGCSMGAATQPLHVLLRSAPLFLLLWALQEGAGTVGSQLQERLAAAAANCLVCRLAAVRNPCAA